MNYVIFFQYNILVWCTSFVALLNMVMFGYKCHMSRVAKNGYLFARFLFLIVRLWYLASSLMYVYLDYG